VPTKLFNLGYLLFCENAHFGLAIKSEMRNELSLSILIKPVNEIVFTLNQICPDSSFFFRPLGLFLDLSGQFQLTEISLKKEDISFKKIDFLFVFFMKLKLNF